MRGERSLQCPSPADCKRCRQEPLSWLQLCNAGRRWSDRGTKIGKEVTNGQTPTGNSATRVSRARRLPVDSECDNVYHSRVAGTCSTPRQAVAPDIKRVPIVSLMISQAGAAVPQSILRRTFVNIDSLAESREPCDVE